MPAHTQNIPIPLPLDGLNTEKNDLHSPPIHEMPRNKNPPNLKKYAPAANAAGAQPIIGSLCSRFEDYFLAFGARIMFIFLPSSLGISSTLANSSKSVAKRSSRISPCSLKTIERPRKKT